MRKHLKRPSPAMGVALIALFIALGGTTYAATGGNFILGQPNTANRQTSLSAAVSGATTGGGKVLQLTNTSTASGAEGLGITVGANKAPIHVNSTAGKATFLNSDKLDGLDSSVFARKAQEPWHEVGTAGEPPFEDSPGGFTGGWENGSAFFNSVGFLKDSMGFVHLKGVVRKKAPSEPAGCGNTTIFGLPVGYRPARTEVEHVWKNFNQIVEVDIWPDGYVRLCTSGATGVSETFVLDGITFRAAG